MRDVAQTVSMIVNAGLALIWGVWLCYFARQGELGWTMLGGAWVITHTLTLEYLWRTRKGATP